MFALALSQITSQAHAQSPQVDLSQLRQEGPNLVAPLQGGGRAITTLDPALQASASKLFREYELPYAAAVMMEIPSGRVVALLGHSELDSNLETSSLALTAWAPAASVFKLITAASLLSTGKVSKDTKACYHGGYSGIDSEHIRDDTRLDKSCDTLTYAIGKSQNALIAKLVTKSLSRELLRKTALSFGFGHKIPFVTDVEASVVDVPGDPLEFARAAAGFFHSSLSPFHGALVAATFANEGVMPRPILIDSATGPDGKDLKVPGRRGRRVLNRKVARSVAAMMEATTRMGTARTSFHDRRGRAFLPFTVAGKTGSLNHRGRLGDPKLPAPGDANGYLQYVWFVGFAPLDNPQVAFAVLLGNPAKWRIKAAYAAQRLLRAWYDNKRKATSKTQQPAPKRKTKPE